MQYTDFIAKVQAKSGLSKEEAIQVTQAVLGTLAQRLTRVKRDHLAAQLPTELKAVVNDAGKSDVFSLESFYERVAARSDSSFHKSLENSRNVMSVLQEALSKGELENIFTELPPEFDELLGKKPDRISATTVDTHELFR